MDFRYPPEAEAFRTLRTNLRYLKVNRDLSSILIASPEPMAVREALASDPPA